MTAEPPSVEGASLGERLPEDDLALDVAQARIAAKLFGVAAEVVVGRYRLLELVGRGGMGVVWGAWDPELERKVAIKLVDPLRSAARDRIVGEARALAKLSHPNIVPIYDVGTVEDRVYLVMEWVAGDNLRAHLAGDLAVREIVDVYVQAARGLAAVHAAGFVHRDFKPENAIVGRDGRVRVLDFGLALSDVERRDGEIAGTPRYMAPEQARGEAPTAAVDQYALCVALREALGEPPRWLGKVIARGTAERPGERFASLEELIAALGRDPARVWRRRVVALAVIASVATAIGFALRGDAVAEPCAGIAALPSGLAAETRARIADQLGRLGGFAAAELPGLERSLDDHERNWRAATDAACRAHANGELTTALYERRLTCLARAQASLMTAADLLARATSETFPDARLAAGSLVDPALCDRVDQSLVAPPAPAIAADVRAAEAAIERARMLATAVRPEAPAIAAEARRHAEATGYAPVIARAQLIEGRALMTIDDPRTREALDRAMRSAFAAHDDVTGVEAFARLAFVVASGEAKALDATVIVPIAGRLGPEGRFARLLLLNNLAVAHMAMNDLAGARPLLRTALRDWQPGGSEDDYELVSIAQNLALVAEDRAESRALLARARAEVTRTLGADHPRTLDIQSFEVLFVDDLASARALQDDECRRYRQFPNLRESRALCEYDAAWLADEAGDDAAARAHFAAAPFDRTTEPIRGELASQLSVPSPDAAALERLAAGAPTDSVWQRGAAADAFIAAATAWERAGDRDRARRCWTRAGAVLEPVQVSAAARRLARIRSRLASLRDH